MLFINIKNITTISFIRNIDNTLLIICIIKTEKYLTNLFHLDIFAFLKKPINLHFNKIFHEAYKKICTDNHYFIYRYKNEEYKIKCNDIMYFESYRRKIKIHLENNTVNIFYGKLNTIEQKLEYGRIPFLRIHQSYLVNFNQVKSLTKTTVTLNNLVTLPISEKRQKKIKFKYEKLIHGEIII